MGKGAKRPRKASRGSSGKPRARGEDDPFLRKDMDDEIDAFHKQRDVIPLNPDDDIGESEEDDLEQPVFDIEGTEDESDEEEEDTPAINNVVKDKGFAAKIARQAKYLKQKFGVDDEMNEDEGEEEEEEDRTALWGRGKNMYYDADNIDYEIQSSDDELLLEEEAEVLKIQREKAKSFSLEDFGVEDDDNDDSDSDGDKESSDPKKSTKRPSKDDATDDGPFHNFEEIKKDFTALSKVEQMDAVYSSTPELIGLLSELNDALDQIQRAKSDGLKVEDKKTKSQGGLSYLEAKHILLLTYSQAITFYLLLKSEGNLARDHPVIGRLVEIKNLLQKMEEIKANNSSEELVDDITLKTSKCTPSGNNSSKVKSDKLNRSSKLLKMASEILKESPRDQNNGKSADDKKQDAQVGIQSLEMLKIRASLEAKLNEKGIYKSTGPKADQMQKDARKSFNRHLESVDDFDDEVHQSALDRSRISSRSKKVSLLVGTNANKFKSVSVDEDFTKQDDIGERRRGRELRVLASAGALDDSDEIADEAEDGEARNSSLDIASQDGEASGSEDEFYREVKKRRTEKQMAKAEQYSRIPAAPLDQDMEVVDGKRQISYQMEKNRGLTRLRKKLTKNPRKKYRVKHASATIRRKGQVRDIRKPSGPYGGEHTGINANISRSLRLKS